MIEAECPICHLEFHASEGAKCPGCGHEHLIVHKEVEDEKKDDPVPEEKSDEKAADAPAPNVSIG